MDDMDHSLDPSFLDPHLHDEAPVCVIAAGDINDVRGLRAWCATLPADAYGQIFIEVFAPFQVEPLKAPERVGVTWICRERLRPSTRPGIGIPRGQALATAVDAWCNEWLRADPGSHHFTLWMGARSSSVMRSFWARIESELCWLWSDEVRERQ